MDKSMSFMQPSPQNSIVQKWISVRTRLDQDSLFGDQNAAKRDQELQDATATQRQNDEAAK